MNPWVEVSAPARLHWGLFDLSAAPVRTFGGLGVMLSEPRTVVRATPSKELAVRGGWLDRETRVTLTQAVQRTLDRLGVPPVEIEVRSHAPEHRGLGSKTSLILAALEATAILHDRDLEVVELQRLSGRGGASGVGINGYFTGGLIIDAGHASGTPLMPSSRQPSPSPPPVLARHPWPKELHIHIGDLQLGPGLSGEDEKRFFELNTPIHREEVLLGLSVVFQRLVPAVLERDLDALAAGLREISAVGFKAREIESQDPAVRSLLAAHWRAGDCVGLSSMGPTFFAITAGMPMRRDGQSCWTRVVADNVGRSVSLGQD